MTARRSHLIWGGYGLLSIVSMWFANTAPGAIAMFACIGLAFLLHRFVGARGSWVAIAVIGFGMGGLMGWQALTGSRCPAPGTKVFLKANKPPVGCDEIRAAAGSMAFLFLLFGGIGTGVPIYLRRLPGDPDGIESSGAPELT